jgi:hypothetical protein
MDTKPWTHPGPTSSCLAGQSFRLSSKKMQHHNKLETLKTHQQLLGRAANQVVEKDAAEAKHTLYANEH